MKKLLTFIACLGAFALQAGIKKAPSDAAAPEPRAEQPKKSEPRSEPESGRMLEDLLNRLLGGGDRKLDAKLNEHYRSLAEGHKPGTLKSAPATFVVRDGKKAGKPIAFATGVNAKGWLLTKASEVKGAAQLEVEIKGKWTPASVSRTWDEHDLALLKVDATDLAAVEWSPAPSPAVGSFITAVAPEGREPVAIGVVSVAMRNIRIAGRGFLGVQVESDDKGLKIGRVVEKGAAFQAGVKKDDRIVELDGSKPDTVFKFTTSISNKKAGDKVRLKLQRGQELIEKEIALGDLSNGLRDRASPRVDRMNSMGSTVSTRKGDFPSVIQTDFPLDASECGGPVTDLDGNVIGLVIARSGRIETLVLPAETIVAALKDVDFSK